MVNTLSSDQIYSILLKKEKPQNMELSDLLIDSIVMNHVNISYLKSTLSIESLVTGEIVECDCSEGYADEKNKVIVGKELTENDFAKYGEGWKFSYCHISFAINLGNRIFNNSFIFQGCVFSEAVEIVNSTFSHDLIFNGCKFKKEVNLEHNYVGRFFRANCCEFEKGLSMSNFKCGSDFSMKSTIFKKRCSFYDSTFNSKTSFSNVVLEIDDEERLLRNTYFEGEVDFASCYFNSFAIFDNVIFSAFVKFNSAVFSGKTFFDNAAFNEVHFKKTRFSMYLSISGAHINGVALFSSTIISEDFICDSTEFRMKPVFYKIEVGKYFRLTNSKLTSELTFYECNFHQDVDVKFKIPAHIQFIKTICAGCFQIAGTYSEINLSESTFRGPLKLSIYLRNTPFPIYTKNIILTDVVQFLFVDQVTGVDETKKPTIYREQQRILPYLEKAKTTNPKCTNVDLLKLTISEEDLELLKPINDSLSVDSLDDLMSTILMIKACYVRQGEFADVDNFSRIYNQHKQEKYHTEDGLSKKIAWHMMTFAEKYYDYGITIRRILLGMMRIILMFTAILCVYHISQMIVSGDFCEMMGLSTCLNILLDSLMESGISFLTMSVGLDTTGLGYLGITICVIDGFFGVFSMSFLVSSVVRKVFR